MAIRLLVILALVVQPLLVVAGAQLCRPVGQVASIGGSACCTVSTSCCTSNLMDPAASHDANASSCGRDGMACQCGAPAPEQPMPAPSRSLEISTILPRLLALTVELPRPPAMRMHALPAVFSPRGADLRAFLCVWLT